MDNIWQALRERREAAFRAQEQDWQFAEPPLGGRLVWLRRFLVEQLVRPVVAPLFAQQQAQNAAILQTTYALAEQLDRQLALTEAQQMRLHDQHAQFLVVYEQLRTLQTQFQMLHGCLQQQEELNLALHIANIEQGMHQLNETGLRRSHLTGQQLRDFADQLVSIEETMTQLLARLGGTTAVPPGQRSEEA
ncbi:MAG: hypothetical protein AB4911_07280 [Oscillochloridaceae bacterium umkhey_bin13]